MSDPLAREVWERYEYGRDRGHRDYCARARRCERFYLGGGLQWDAADLAVLREQGRPAHEINLIAPAVNAVVGYQINNRMQIAYRPRGQGADEQTADVLSKLAMQVADNNQFRWRETELFADDMIQQRGYYDIRMDFGDAREETFLESLLRERRELLAENAQLRRENGQLLRRSKEDDE